MASPCQTYPTNIPRDSTSRERSMLAEKQNTAINEEQRTRKPRKRRSPVAAQATSQNGKQQAFYFVDTNSSSREKRAHVMRHHIEEKRRLHKLSGIDHDKQQNRPLRSLQWKKKPSQEDAEPLSSSAANPDQALQRFPSRPPDSFAQTHRSLPGGPQMAGPVVQSTSNFPVISPMSLLGSSRRDPFDSLPTMFGLADLDLADFWTSKLTYWSGPNQYMKNQIFRIAMSSPLTFQAVILTYCARWKHQMLNLHNSKEIQRRIAEPKRMVDAALKGQVKADEETLSLALTGLSLSEERFGDKDTADQYAERAAQLIRSRVGCFPRNETLLHFIRYTMTPRNTAINPEGERRLVTFLRATEQLMAKQSTDAYLAVVPLRRDAFQMDHPLYALLASGPRPSVVPPNHRIYVVGHRFLQDICRIGCLTYITTALWEYKDSPIKTSRFLSHICSVVEEHNLDRHPANETLLWVLLEEERYETNLKDPERSWTTGELLKILKQLPYDLWFQFGEILMSLLSLNTPIRGIEAFEEQLRKSSGVRLPEEDE